MVVDFGGLSSFFGVFFRLVHVSFVLFCFLFLGLGYVGGSLGFGV